MCGGVGVDGDGDEDDCGDDSGIVDSAVMAKKAVLLSNIAGWQWWRGR